MLLKHDLIYRSSFVDEEFDNIIWPFIAYSVMKRLSKVHRSAEFEEQPNDFEGGLLSRY